MALTYNLGLRDIETSPGSLEHIILGMNLEANRPDIILFCQQEDSGTKSLAELIDKRIQGYGFNHMHTEQLLGWKLNRIRLSMLYRAGVQVDQMLIWKVPASWAKQSWEGYGGLMAHIIVEEKNVAFGCGHFNKNSKYDRNQDGEFFTEAFQERRAAGAQFMLMAGDLNYKTDLMEDGVRSQEWKLKERTFLANKLITEKGRKEVWQASAWTAERHAGTPLQRDGFVCAEPGMAGPAYGPTSGRTPGSPECAKWTYDRSNWGIVANCFWGESLKVANKNTLEDLWKRTIGDGVTDMSLANRMKEPLKNDIVKFLKGPEGEELKIGFPERFCWKNLQAEWDPTWDSIEDDTRRKKAYDEWQADSACISLIYQFALEEITFSEHVPVLYMVSLRSGICKPKQPKAANLKTTSKNEKSKSGDKKKAKQSKAKKKGKKKK